jgi:hypothetical protein
MKRNITVLGAILLVGGIALGAIAFASVGFNPQKLSIQAEFQQKQFQVEAGKVRSIEIADENNSIELTHAQDQNITITYYESQKDRYDLGVDGNGRLAMRYVNERKWYEYLGILWGRPNTHVTVALPEGFRSDLTLTTVNGTISAEALLAGSLRASTTNGDIRLTAVSASGEANASTVNGQILLDGLTADSPPPPA